MTDEQADDLAELHYELDQLRLLLADVELVNSVVLAAVEKGWSRCEEPTNALVSCARLKLHLAREIQAGEDRLPRCDAEADYYGDPLVCGREVGHTGLHRDETMNCDWTDVR